MKNLYQSIEGSTKWMALLGIGVLMVGTALFVGNALADTTESFPTSEAVLELEAPFQALNGSSSVTNMSGPAQVFVKVGTNGEADDSDTDGKDDVETELLSMNLTGGGIAFMTRPTPSSTGMMDENTNNTSGTLEVPPYASGTADSFFDVFFEITLNDGTKLRNPQALRISNPNYMPGRAGDTFESQGTSTLINENGSSTTYVVKRFSWTPIPLPQPKLTVKKIVINDNGGTATSSNFTMTVSSTATSTQSFDGSVSGTVLMIPGGPYKVTESGPAGYTSSSSSGCAGTIARGEMKECIFTNNDIPVTPTSTPTSTSRIIVKKIVINNDGGTATSSNFTMIVSSTATSTKSFPGSASGTVVLVYPGPYKVTESGPAGYSSSTSGQCAGTIDEDEDKECIFTNNDIPPTPTTTGALDHFKCYDVKKSQPINDFVFLFDQFGMRDQRFERDRVEESEFFCNPTRKIHGNVNVGVSNLMNHLTWYDIDPLMKEKFQRRIVEVKNQFVPNGARLVVKKPKFLVVPTQKASVNGTSTNLSSPQNLDHFKCYEVNGEKVDSRVKLQDQFDQMPPGSPNTFEDVLVKKPEFLCNPTNKFHFTGFDNAGAPQWYASRIQNPNDHLVCYSITSRTERSVKDLVIQNQFGEQKLSTTKPEILCVPSTKTIITEIPTPPGETNEEEED